MPAGLSITPDPESVVKTEQDPEAMMNKMRDSMSTNFQWQKAFSKGDQNVNAKKRQFELESDFVHQCEQVEFKIDAIKTVLTKIC